MAVGSAAGHQHTALARAAAGVFVLEDSQRNVSIIIDGGPQTRRYAATVAAAAALDIAVDACSGRLQDLPSQPRRIVLKAASADLVRVMTELVFEWRRRGFRRGNGSPILHGELWARIDAAARQVEDTGVQLQFWQVSQRENREAYGLAYRALDVLYSEQDAPQTGPAAGDGGVGEDQGFENEEDDGQEAADEHFPLGPHDFEWAFRMARGEDWKLGPPGWDRDASGWGLPP